MMIFGCCSLHIDDFDKVFLIWIRMKEICIRHPYYMTVRVYVYISGLGTAFFLSSERIVLLRSFKERNILLRSFFEFLVT